jgi:hypothetical protein
MKPAEAQKLWQTLAAAYPQVKLTEETISLYLKKLMPWNAEIGTKAVASALETCRYMPTIAELHHHYGVVREQTVRDHKAEQTRLERMAEDNLPHVPLQEIPVVNEHLAKLRGTSADELLNLEEAGEGKCDDCPKRGPRYRFFKLALCPEHVAARLRVKAELSIDEEAIA